MSGRGRTLGRPRGLVSGNRNKSQGYDGKLRNSRAPTTRNTRSLTPAAGGARGAAGRSAAASPSTRANPKPQSPRPAKGGRKATTAPAAASALKQKKGKQLPKLHDNPPAPEIVEKLVQIPPLAAAAVAKEEAAAAKPVVANGGNHSDTEKSDSKAFNEDEEEEEVSDVEEEEQLADQLTRQLLDRVPDGGGDEDQDWSEGSDALTDLVYGAVSNVPGLSVRLTEKCTAEKISEFLAENPESLMSQNGWRQLAEFLVSAEPVKNGCATDDGMNSDGNADPAVLEGNGGGASADKKTQGEDGTDPLRNEIKPENIHADADDCIVDEDDDDDDEEGAVIIVQDEDSEIPKDANALVVRVKEPPGESEDPYSVTLDTAAVTAAVAAVATTAVDSSKTSALRKIRIDRPKKEEFEDGAGVGAVTATVAPPLLSLKSPQLSLQSRHNISPRGRHRVAAYAKRSTGAALGPSVLSKGDAEVVVFAVRNAAVNPPPPPPPQSHHQEGHSSLKTVIRLPKTPQSTAMQASMAPPSIVPTTSKSGKKKRKGNPGQSEDPEAAANHDSKKQRIEPSNELQQQQSSAYPAEGNASSNHQPNNSNSNEEKPIPEFGTHVMVPEKASSFKIHPLRCCSDVCYYCGLKFGMLDTPMHIMQLKTAEIQVTATGFTGFKGDACLCDKCFRFIDRKAKSILERKAGGAGSFNQEGAGGGGDPDDPYYYDSNGANETQLSMKKCVARNCNREVISTVSKKWLLRLKKKLINKKLRLDWDRVGRASVKTPFPVCTKHHSIVDMFMKCGLCKSKLNLQGGICSLGMGPAEVQTLNGLMQSDGIPASLLEIMFVCKLCKTFCNIRQKAEQPNYLKNHTSHRAFYRNHKKRVQASLGMDSPTKGDDDSGHSPPTKKISVVNDNPTKITIKMTAMPDEGSASVSPPGSSQNQRPGRKRKGGQSSDESSGGNGGPAGGAKQNGGGGTTGGESVTTSHHHKGDRHKDREPGKISVVDKPDKNSVHVRFDHSTKKLWQDMHYPYGSYTSFFRHLMLLERYWRKGDLRIAENASLKASNYLKSVRNRVDAYEESHKRSDAELSACTRPDLSVPPPPDGVLTHDDEEEEDEAKDVPVAASAASQVKEKDTTILKVPVVSRAPENGSDQPPPPPPPPAPAVVSPDPPPTKIRVRTDLMHLGLMEAKQPEKKAANPQPPPSSSSNLMQILNGPPLKTPADKTSKAAAAAAGSAAAAKGPSLGKVPLVGSSSTAAAVTSTVTTPSIAHAQSSNRHLFQNSSGSSAIPLTFNNSIAEVLAAAQKSKEMQASKAAAAAAKLPKPDVTITSKQQQQVNSGSSKFPDKLHQRLTSPQKSFHEPGLAAASNINSGMGTAASSSPLTDMSKLLLTQAPVVPPHLVAQNSSLPNIPSAATGRATATVTSASTSRPFPPPAATSTAAVAKPRSLNNVLDRLNKGTPSAAATTASSIYPQLSPLAAQHYIQQQQQSVSASQKASYAAAAAARKSPGQPQKPTASVADAGSSIAQAQVAALAQQAAMSPELGLLLGLRSGLTPSVSEAPAAPWGSTARASQQAAQLAQSAQAAQVAQQAQQAQAAQAAQTALLMAGAGHLPGINPVAAAAAMQELMKISMSQMGGGSPSAAQLSAAAAAAAEQAANHQKSIQSLRLRAPPPLTHMGRHGGAGGGSAAGPSGPSNSNTPK